MAPPAEDPVTVDRPTFNGTIIEAAVALVAMVRAAFETTSAGRQPGRDTAGTALELLAGGLGSYATAGPAHE